MKFIRNNALSLAFFVLFVASLCGQFFAGFADYNKERKEYHREAVSYTRYFTSGHFIQATFENWESEFLQMALFVLFTIWFKQKGSSESKKFDGSDEVDRKPSPIRPGAPWAVRKGGWILQLYKHSLTIVLSMLFLLCIVLHFYGSLLDENEKLSFQGLPPETISQYLTDSRFWFESFQNWQSEFLSIFSIIVLSIFLRQQGSPQSKPVDAPHAETGE